MVEADKNYHVSKLALFGCVQLLDSTLVPYEDPYLLEEGRDQVASQSTNSTLVS
jgi:hypothetical protein